MDGYAKGPQMDGKGPQIGADRRRWETLDVQPFTLTREITSLSLGYENIFCNLTKS